MFSGGGAGRKQPEGHVRLLGRSPVHAYILIQNEVGHSGPVAAEVRAIKGIISCDAVTGPYDIIAEAEAETLDELGRGVVRLVQGVEGITRTVTCPVIHL